MTYQLHHSDSLITGSLPSHSCPLFRCYIHLIYYFQELFFPLEIISLSLIFFQILSKSDIQFDAMVFIWSIRNSGGSQPTLDFSRCNMLVNSEDPVEMLQNAAFHLRLHCLQKFQLTMGLKPQYICPKKCFTSVTNFLILI